jgi:hypothetical protein
MSERQKHGFNFEEEIIKKYNIQKSENYTSKFDGYLNGYPVSVKCEKNGSSIEMADYFRNSENTEDFYLIVGFWEGANKEIVDTKILFIPGIEWQKLFYLDINKKLKCLLNEISNDYTDDDEWKRRRLELTAEWKKNTPNLISLYFKRDHKKQKRIQCGITYKNFFSYFIPKYEVKEL